MPLPKRKTSHARTARRRAANFKLTLPNPGSCPRCQAPKLQHHVCPTCGFYGNRMVIDMRRKTARAQPASDAQGGDAE